MATGTILWTGKSATGKPRYAQMQTYMFCVNGADKDAPWKVLPTSPPTWKPWGLAAPNFTPTATENDTGVGYLPAGTYSYIFCWYRASDNYESPGMTAWEFTVTIPPPGLARIDFYGLPSNADTGIHLRLYRKNATGSAYHRVGTAEYDIANGVTTYNDGVAPATQEAYAALSLNHGLPPKADFLVAYQSCIWALGIYNDGSYSKYPDAALRRDMFAYSLPGEPDYFPAAQREAVDTRAGKILAGAVYGSSLILCCERATFKIQGVTTTTIEIRQGDDAIGILAPDTLCNINMPGGGQALVWLSHGQFSVYGGGSIEPAPPAMRKVLEGLDIANLKNACAHVDTTFQEYICYVKDASQDSGYVALVWCFGRPGAPWEIRDGAAFTAATSYRSQDLGDNILGGDEYGQLHRYDPDACAWSARGTDFDLAGTIQGTATGGSTTYLDDSGAAFYNSAGKLANIQLFVQHASGVIDARRISTNTGTRLTPSAPFSTAVLAGAKYYVGGIQAWAKTPPMNLGDDNLEKTVFWLSATMGCDAGASNVTIDPYYDYGAAAGTSVLLDSTKKFDRKSMTGRFRQVALKIRHLSSTAHMRMRSLALHLLPNLDARKE